MRFQRFLDSLATDGGHILLLALGAVLGAAMAHYGIADGHTVLIGSGGALLALLRPKS